MMSRRAYLVTLVVSLLVLVAGSVSAGSSKFACNQGGRVVRVFLDTGSTFSSTLTWTKSAADNDLFFFDTDGVMLGLGIGVAPRYEFVAIGGLPGFAVDVLVIKVSGPNGPCILRTSNELTNLRAERGARLRDLGSLDSLAARDPKYAAMREAVGRYIDLKRPAE